MFFLRNFCLFRKYGGRGFSAPQHFVEKFFAFAGYFFKGKRQGKEICGTENKKAELLKGLTKEMAIDLPNRGIAVCVPLTSIASRRTLEAFADKHQNDEPENEVKDMTQYETELIIAICESGYAEKVMEAARGAGAAGGTVVHAKGTGAKYAKFFGLTLADEKEMIYIVSSTENKKNIMTAIVDGAGPHTSAHTVVFSLPVSDTAGLRIFDK